LLRPVVQLFTRRESHGAEHLPREGGVVLAVNHLSFLDPLVVAYFVDDEGRAPRFLAKAELFSVPVFGRLLRGAGQIPVRRRTSAAAKAYADAVAAVRRGECVVVYPEGTLTFDPGLWPMRARTGAARVALETRAPVLPVAQWGIQQTLGPRTKRLRLFPRARIQIVVGPPVPLDDLYDRYTSDPSRELAAEATERVMTAITVLLEELRGESAPTTRFDPTTMVRTPAAPTGSTDERQSEPMQSIDPTRTGDDA